MKSVKERKQELRDIAEDNDPECIYSNGDVEVYVTEYEHRGGDYFSYVFTSSVHWTDDAVTVRTQQKWKDQWEVDISYGSGGTLASDPKQIAEAMEVIFREARKKLEELEKRTQ